MAKYRDNLPLTRGGTFLTDGGMETSLIFKQGIDLPEFASFPLLDSQDGRAALTRYYENFLKLARDRNLGFVLDTATWRASREWGAKLGYDEAALTELNRKAVALIASLRQAWEKPSVPLVLNGVIGPRGDGYKGGRMSLARSPRLSRVPGRDLRRYRGRHDLGGDDEHHRRSDGHCPRRQGCVHAMRRRLHRRDGRQAGRRRDLAAGDRGG